MSMMYWLLELPGLAANGDHKSSVVSSGSKHHSVVVMIFYFNI